jgi:puromycin-sensitive aminopeptidase
MAATQFEPADARRMLPCFDEPDMKARFKLTVVTDPKFSAVSNAPLIRETIKNNQKTSEFEPTEPMSSYLLALVIGEMEATNPLLVEGTPIRVISAKGMGHLTHYARGEAAKLLPVLNKYFGINYPWKKLDLVAVPEFAAGAMENPGCITFRESLLLIDPKTASTGAQKACTGVTAHEMAHLWFGDLVTMKWWDDIWLNEAFATWMATKATDAVRPEWELWKDYVWDRIQGMNVDSLHSTRTIHSTVKSPQEIHEMFDAITYDKGSAVLRMLERHVGEPVFQKGVQQYMKAHQFGNATTDDLWNAIGASSGTSVRDLMHGWVYQPGFPLVTVGQSAARNGAVTFHQQRFYKDGGQAPTNELWWVPIGLRLVNKPAEQKQQSQPDRKYLLQEKGGSCSMVLGEGERTDLPVIANAGGVGYYRARYDDALYARILEQPLGNFDPSERISLIDDTNALMTAGQIPVTRYLELVSHYKNETDDGVWYSMMGGIGFFDRFIDKASRPAYERFVRDQLSQVYARLGWTMKPTDSPQTRQLRGSVISTLGTIGQDQEVIAEARKRFAQYVKDKHSLDRDLIGAVTSVVAYNGDAADYAQFRQLSLKAATPEERVRNLFALSGFRSADLANQTLTYALSKQVRLQDVTGLISGVLGQPETQDQAWSFVTTNWSKIRGYLPEDMVPHLVASAGSFSYAKQLAEMKSFLAANPVPSGKITTARAIERSAINVRFREKSAAELNKWMQSKFGV